MTRTESSLKTHKVLSHTHSLAVSCKRYAWQTEFLDDHRALEPPDPFPNSAVKRCIADGSVGFPHVRVGHRQDSNPKPLIALRSGVLSFLAHTVALPPPSWPAARLRIAGGWWHRLPL